MKKQINKVLIALLSLLMASPALAQTVDIMFIDRVPPYNGPTDFILRAFKEAYVPEGHKVSGSIGELLNKIKKGEFDSERGLAISVSSNLFCEQPSHPTITINDVINALKERGLYFDYRYSSASEYFECRSLLKNALEEKGKSRKYWIDNLPNLMASNSDKLPNLAKFLEESTLSERLALKWHAGATYTDSIRNTFGEIVRTAANTSFGKAIANHPYIAAGTIVVVLASAGLAYKYLTKKPADESIDKT